MANCECKNNYTNEEVFMESFCGSDDAIKNCESCPNFVYEDGTYICTKFNNQK